MARVILTGSPNSGKSLLFNRLTGLSQKVANFPGITVDVGTGRLHSLPEKELVDFPGTYSLQAISAEEQLAVDYFENALADDAVEQQPVLDCVRREDHRYRNRCADRVKQVAASQPYLTSPQHVRCDDRQGHRQVFNPVPPDEFLAALTGSPTGL